MMPRVLVLNTTYEPLNVCSARRAVVLLLKDKAEVVQQSAAVYHSERSTFGVPYVIRLRDYVAVPRGVARRLSRRAVFARDRHRCQYCGSDRRLTVDHVVPRSKGGAHDWENVVTSCAPCNLRKGDRTPAAAQMRLTRRPRPPEPASFVYMYRDDIHDSWLPYLEFAGAVS
jgi:5-methylcytosine-specific restriction endonuclease McrA